MTLRKWMITMVLAVAAISIAGCSSGDESDKNDEPKQEEKDQSKDQENNEPSQELSSDDDLQKTLKQEDEVKKAMVQLVEGEDKESVNIDIQLKAEKEWNDDLKTKYQDIIRNKYPDKPVDIIIAQDGTKLDQYQLD
ncbi:hypothetical protein GCM10008983_09750 [Lentibacillus halophilus]|uniref:Lipoprotein n=1 Tax=Lentibacillus halophilus TaxID=295065 RepID=A0ABN0Z5Z2_9BACI